MQLHFCFKWYTESINYICPKKDKDDTKPSINATGSSVSWLNKLLIHKISNKFSRNNTPSRANLVSKVVKSNSYGDNQLILVACEQKNAAAIASAISRVYPLYSAKTSDEDVTKTRNVSVSFVYTDSANSSPSQEEIKC